MELRQLKSFVVIAKIESFTKAADALGYAQSTVTTHIQMLETELCVRLFERFGHKVSLTSEGEALLSYAEKVLQLTAEAKEVVTPSLNGPRGTLTIGTGESIATYRLPKILREYRKLYPQVEIVLKYANCSTLRDSIRRNEVDAGLFIEREMIGPDFTVKKLSYEKMILLMAPDNPLAQLERVTPYNLDGECIIITEPGCSFRLNIESIVSKFHVTPRSLLEANGLEAIKQFVTHGLGVAVLPSFVAEREVLEKKIHSVSFSEYSFEYIVQFIYHKDKWVSPALRAFLEVAQRFEDELQIVDM